MHYKTMKKLQKNCTPCVFLRDQALIAELVNRNYSAFSKLAALQVHTNAHTNCHAKKSWIRLGSSSFFSQPLFQVLPASLSFILTAFGRNESLLFSVYRVKKSLPKTLFFIEINKHFQV